ncbi:MAG: YifB family Mg chelatase-like AAA ATPase, partial [Candidatus Aminicenantes bacterium]|nr:YifB family Mg chelatase-like AAA ATPase [Candidatus Aminicenantes bacterium]
MLYKSSSAALQGIEAYVVEVEVDISGGLPNYIVVGLPDASVRESKERVKAALKNNGHEFPPRRVTINLAPADRRKEGSAFDLPIALAHLAYLDEISADRFPGYLFLAELALDGRLKPVKGILSAAILAKKRGFKAVVVPRANAREAALVEEIDIYGLDNINQVVQLLRGDPGIVPCVFDREAWLETPPSNVDFGDVKGQPHIKRALEVAAAGSHNILMIGPPGSGKTMLARRIPSILPAMTFEEIIETTRVYSAAGLLRDQGPIVRRPFRSPHHTISDAGLIGGGMVPRPGEVSLAHHGVLFMDELPEFERDALEALRQPLEDGEVTVARVALTAVFPSSFMLVAAMNPCHDVLRGTVGKDEDCTERQRSRYYAKISGPLLDRIDIQVEVPAVTFREIVSKQAGEGSEAIRGRVSAARARQVERFRGKGIFSNARMGTREVREFCPIGRDEEKLLEAAVNTLGFSARAYDRSLKVARTIADLAGEDRISIAHLSEAIQYRA